MTIEFLRARLDALYDSERGIGRGFDREMTDSEVLAFAGRKARDRLRATLRGYRGVYIGSHVSLHYRSRISLGEGVAIADDVLISGLSRNGVRLGPGVTVDRGAVLRGSGGVRRLGEHIIVGERAAIGVDNFIHGGGGVTIGEHTLLGPHVQIFSETHVASELHKPILEQGELPLPVNIGRRCWIGAGSIILGGVTIGDDVIVAAGAIVNRDVADLQVVAGVPARVVKSRSDANGSRIDRPQSL